MTYLEKLKELETDFHQKMNVFNEASHKSFEDASSAITSLADSGRKLEEFIKLAISRGAKYGDTIHEIIDFS